MNTRVRCEILILVLAASVVPGCGRAAKPPAGRPAPASDAPASPAQPASPQTVVVPPKGEYAEIDVAHLNDTVRVLAQGSPAERSARAAMVEEDAAKYAPPALFALGRALFLAGRKDDGAFWFFAGALRGRYDVRRSTDASVADSVTVLARTHASEILAWARTEPEAFEKQLERALAWDAKTPHDYDPRWISLHGMGAMLSGMSGAGAERKELTIPRDQWDAVAETTRTAFRAEWTVALRKLRETPK